MQPNHYRPTSSKPGKVNRTWKKNKAAHEFESIWQGHQNKMAEDKQFADMLIRNWVRDQGDLQTASERLGHASTVTTNKHYRSNVTKVMLLVS